MKRALIISIKFAPGLPKEFFTIGEKLKENGYEIDYMLTSQYKSWINKKHNVYYLNLFEKNILSDYFFGWKSIRNEIINNILSSKKNYEYITVYNPHPLNSKIMSLFKTYYPKSIRSVVLHEPYVKFKNKIKYGFKGFFKCFALDLFSFLLIIQCTDLIFPSTNSYNLYHLRVSSWFSKKKEHVIPLMLNMNKQEVNNKYIIPYISFVGTVNNARGIKDFEKIIRIINKYDINLKIRILTRNKIMIDLDNVEYIIKDKITDKEISDFVKKSVGLYLTHKVAAQSGNIPVAYMVGTPIICNDVKGITQDVIDGKTGLILYKEYTDLEIKNLLIDLINNQKKYDANCLELFNNKFSSKNFSRYYKWLFEKRIIND